MMSSLSVCGPSLQFPPPILNDDPYPYPYPCPFSDNELLDELLSVIEPGQGPETGTGTEEFPAIIHHHHSPSGSETGSQNVLFPSHSQSTTSGSEGTRSVYSAEERKRRRKISNQLSARRSRWRKKQQLEDLTNQVNQLNDENRELRNLLCLLRQQYHSLQLDSARLMVESIDLQRKLDGLLMNQSSVNIPLPY